MKRLNDPELDQLVAAALAEQQRRGRKPSALDEGHVGGGLKQSRFIDEWEVERGSRCL